MPRSFYTIVVTLLLASTFGCKKKPLSVSTTAYILGPQSLIAVVSPREQSEIDPRVLNASVLVSTRLGPSEVKFCSGTLIESDQPGGNLRVIANHHCFAEVDSEGIATSELLPEACLNTKVYLGFFAGQTESSTITECLPGSLRTSLDGDLSIFRLAAKVPDQFQPLSLANPNSNLAGRQTLIVHYPDIKSAKVESPDGGPKLPLAQVTRERCKVIGNFPIGHWQFDRSLPYSVKHTCDLTHGSSGSGLIDVATSQLIGVNWGGIKINDNGQTETVNVATGISFVHAFLNFNTAKIEQEAAKALVASEASSTAPKENSGGVLHATGVTKRLGCGVVGVAKDGPEFYGWILLWTAPIIAAVFSGGTLRRRRPLLSVILLGLSASLGTIHQDAVAATPAAEVDAMSTLSAEAKTDWATAYLLSTVFIAEYDSLVAYDRAAASIMKRERPLHTAEWMRAHAGLSYIKSSGLDLPELDRLSDQVASDPAARAHAQFIADFKIADREGIKAIVATFKSPEWAERWQRLSPSFTASLPRCELSREALAVLKLYAAPAIPLETAGTTVKTGNTGSPTQVSTLSPADRSCLLITMTKVPSGAGETYQITNLLSLMASGERQTVIDPDVLAVYAARQVAERHYAEALSVLVGMVEKDASFRLPYELVQRAYSWRQRGSGKVAIQGL
ncbi:MAG: hypothetical protein RL011_788 [Pseudomonadota bacterium]